MTRAVRLPGVRPVHLLRSTGSGCWLLLFTWPLLSGVGLLSAWHALALVLTLVLLDGLLPSVHRLWTASAAAFLWLYGWQSHRSFFRFDFYRIVGRWIRAFVAVQHGQSIPADLGQVFVVAGLALLYGLLTYACTRRNLWLFYNALAVCVWLMLDVTGRFRPGLWVVGSLAVGVLLLGVDEWERLAWIRQAEPWRPELTAASNVSGAIRFALVVFSVAFSCLIAAFVLPKTNVHANLAAPWPNSNTTGGVPPLSVTGYTSDVRHLGGSLIGNDDPVLNVISPYPTYLRGQSYDTYTGKGWLNTSNLAERFLSGQPLPPEDDLFGTALAVRQSTMTITVLRQPSTDVLFGGYSIRQIALLQGRPNSVLTYHPADGSIRSSLLSEQDSYRETSETLVEPDSHVAHLPALSLVGDHLMGAALPQEDLQLPGELPASVRVLADRLASGSTSEFEQVKRVEAYLRAHDRYATQHIPTPTGQTDFVAQFLFDSHRGYCDQFATALVILLRETGVPARLATGYTQGARDVLYHGPGQRYVVRALDAHAWAEVYFPGAGWVSFDPTPGYAVPTAPHDKGVAAGNGDVAAAGTLGFGERPVTQANPSTGDGHSRHPGQTPGGVRGGHVTTPVAGARDGIWWAVAAVAVVGLSGGAVALWVWRRQKGGRRWFIRHDLGVPGSGARSLAAGRDVAPGEALRLAVTRLISAMREAGMGVPTHSTLRDIRPFVQHMRADQDAFDTAVRRAERAWYSAEPPSEREVRETLSLLHSWTQRILK